MAESETPNREPRLAFIVVQLGERTHGEATTALVDLSEAIDAVPGCATESFGAFPVDQRTLLTAYVEAARKQGEPR